MSEEMSVETSKAVDKFMADRGWQGHLCSACGKIFFSKSSVGDTEMSNSVCGWNKCDKGTYPFRAFTKQKRMLTPAQISDRIGAYFSSVGLGVADPRNIANFDGQTDLVIAGVQMFDDIIHRNQPIREDKMFVAQPCVRMQFQPHVESHEGTSTSFVNVCTEGMGATFDDHLKMVDHWFTILSKLGLHMNNFTIVMRVSSNDWGTGKFSSTELFFSYGGLELGDAANLLIPQVNRAPIPISDVGFGLERIAWAINKTDSYFDELIPWDSEGPKEMFDSCRTLALLALCGVQATNKGPGLQFRRFSKVLSDKYYGKDIYYVLAYYFDYWAQFVKPSVCREIVIHLVRLEVERFINLRVCEMLKLPSPRDETTEAYLNRLVYTCNGDIHELRKAIQSCKA